MRNLRIHIVSFLGGVPPRTSLQKNSLIKFGFDASIIANNNPQNIASDTGNGIVAVGTPLFNRLAKRNLLKYLRAPIGYLEYLFQTFWTLKRKIGRGDIVQLNHPMLLLLSPLIRKTRVKTFYDAFEFYSLVYRDFALPGRILARLCNYLEAHYARKIDGVICTASRFNWLKDRFAQLNSTVLELPNLPTIRRTVDESLRELLKARYRDRKLVVYAGGLKPKKGIENFAAIAKTVSAERPECHFLIIGSISVTETEKRWLEHQQIEHCCTFIPWAPADHLFTYLELCRVGLILMTPKRAYWALGPGGGRKLFTYMAAGLPVIAPDFGSAWDLVSEEKIGFQVDTTQTEAVAAALVRLLKNRDLCERMSRKARSLFLNKFNWEKHEKEYVAFLTNPQKDLEP